MSFTANDKRDILRAINSGFRCSDVISIRPICIDDGAGGCFRAYGVYKTTETGSELLRIETVDGESYPEDTPFTVVSCNCDCVDLLSNPPE